MEALPVGHPLAADITQYDLWLRAAGRAPKTRKIYTGAATWLARGLDAPSWDKFTRAGVRAHMAAITARYSPAYASNQHRALLRFAEFIAAEYGVPSFMAGMKPPPVPEKVVPVFPPGDLGRLLAACDGIGYADRRDTALIRLLSSSGARRAEIAGLRVTDLDLPAMEAIVTGKAGKQRIIRFDPETALALSRYLKLRGRRKDADSGALWLGLRGSMTGDGIYQTLERRAMRAGVEDVFPHRFRHDFSHRWLLAGGDGGDLMQQNGWTSRQMLDRYGASAAAERAREHYDQVMGKKKAG